MARVAIFLGENEDWEVLSTAANRLDAFGIPYARERADAIRGHATLVARVAALEARGIELFLCGVSPGNPLGAVVAAHSTRPVIAVPLDPASLQGLDALLSSVQMPVGVPVATLAIGKAGADNAAILAAQILSLADPELARRLDTLKEEMALQVKDKDAALRRGHARS